MIRQGHEDTNFFIGDEVEHTPMKGRTTLFVVGLQPTATINQVIQNNPQRLDHIYFGANHSFVIAKDSDWQQWEDMIGFWLDRGHWCTLDIPMQYVEGLAESGLVEHEQFIPMLSARIPYARLLGYNAVLKIDDRDFAATNPGVWCHSLHDLMDRKQFTAWDQYSADKTLG